MNTRLIRRTIMATCAAALSAPALAHLGGDSVPHAHDTLSSFVAGWTHPISGLDHLAAMVSVGLWSVLGSLAKAGQGRTGSAMWLQPIAFALTLLMGAVAGMTGLNLPGIEPMIAASLLVLGLLVAARASWPAAASVSLVAGFAFFHGLAHGQELSGHAMATLGGMVLSTFSLHLVGMCAGWTLRDAASPVRRWIGRATGTAVALFGLSLLTPAVAAAI